VHIGAVDFDVPARDREFIDVPVVKSGFDWVMVTLSTTDGLAIGPPAEREIDRSQVRFAVRAE